MTTAMTSHRPTVDALIARNPATGEEIGTVPATDSGSVPGIVARCRRAQERWAETGWRERRELLRRWKAILAREAESLADALRDEIGKPRIEALGEVISTLDAIRWTIEHGRQALADEWIGPGHQRWMLVPGARLRWKPVGVVGMIGTWNYPLFLDAPPIAQALAAGCGVVWKPSEMAPQIGRRIQETLDEAGVPEGLVAAVHGGADVGRALVESDIDKGMFTGGVENGRRVLGALAARGVPGIAELSGFDPAVVLPDAPLDSTARALAWSAFVNAGQTCIGVKRVYVVGDPAPWVEALARHASTLRVGDPAGEVDMGPLISPAARDRVDRFVRAAVVAGARVLAGGEAIPGPGCFYRPTVLVADGPGVEDALAGVFGPVVLVRGVADADAAVEAANAGAYGLAASVWGSDLLAARAVADRLRAGMVSLNDAVTPSALASAPFGGVKASGYGRTKGVLGLREFAAPQTLHERSAGGFRPQVFPYAARTERLLSAFRRWIHPGA